MSQYQIPKNSEITVTDPAGALTELSFSGLCRSFHAPDSPLSQESVENLVLNADKSEGRVIELSTQTVNEVPVAIDVIAGLKGYTIQGPHKEFYIDAVSEAEVSFSGAVYSSYDDAYGTSNSANATITIPTGKRLFIKQKGTYASATLKFKAGKAKIGGNVMNNFSCNLTITEDGGTLMDANSLFNISKKVSSTLYTTSFTSCNHLESLNLESEFLYGGFVSSCSALTSISLKFKKFNGTTIPASVVGSCSAASFISIVESEDFDVSTDATLTGSNSPITSCPTTATVHISYRLFDSVVSTYSNAIVMTDTSVKPLPLCFIARQSSKLCVYTRNYPDDYSGADLSRDLQYSFNNGSDTNGDDWTSYAICTADNKEYITVPAGKRIFFRGSNSDWCTITDKDQGASLRFEADSSSSFDIEGHMASIVNNATTSTFTLKALCFAELLGDTKPHDISKLDCGTYFVAANVPRAFKGLFSYSTAINSPKCLCRTYTGDNGFESLFERASQLEVAIISMDYGGSWAFNKAFSITEKLKTLIIDVPDILNALTFQQLTFMAGTSQPAGSKKIYINTDPDKIGSDQQTWNPAFELIHI